jgi:AcrR family transcriptional regulator
MPVANGLDAPALATYRPVGKSLGSELAMAPSRIQVTAEATPRRDRILAETLRIVGERGYHGFGIQELAQRCGLTKPGLLHHFGSKDQLLISLLNEVDAEKEAELAELFGAAFGKAVTPDEHRETFRGALRAIMERALAEPQLMRLRVVLRVEAINPRHPAHGYFVARQQATLGRLASGAAAFSASAESLARVVYASMAGLEEQWLRENRGFDLLAEWDRALEVLLPRA